MTEKITFFYNGEFEITLDSASHITHLAETYTNLQMALQMLLKLDFEGRFNKDPFNPIDPFYVLSAYLLSKHLELYPYALPTT